MKKYFLLTIVAGSVLVGCQQVDESGSTTTKTEVSKIEAPAENTAVVDKKEDATFEAEINTKELANLPSSEKKVEPPLKKPTAKPKQKPVKKESKPKKPKKRLSADLVKNTKTAAPKKDQSKIPLPKLEFEYKTYNFGTVDEGDTILHKFKFVNTGDAPVIISDASTSCGCTVPSYPRKPIKPGGKGIIEVMFNTKGKLLEQKKSITLTANTEPMYNTLYLEGLVYRRPEKKEEEKEEEKKDAKKKGKAAKKNNAKKDATPKKKKTPKNKTAKPNKNISDSIKNKLKTDSLKSKKSIDLSKHKKKKP